MGTQSSPKGVLEPYGNLLWLCSFRKFILHGRMEIMETEQYFPHNKPISTEIIKKGLHLAAVETSFGQVCLENIVKKLSDLFGIDYVFIGVFDEQRPNWIRSLAFCEQGELKDNFSYSLDNTPCSNVVGDTMCVYEEDVHLLFPKDKLLEEMGIRGYIGAPIFNAAAEGIGILVLLQKSSLIYSEEMQSLVQLYAARAGLEIDRMKYEVELNKFNDVLIQKDEDLLRAEKIAKLGRWKWFVKEDNLVCSNIVKDIFKYPEKIVPNTLASITKEGLFTKDSIELIQKASKNATKNGASFEIELEFSNADKIPNWVKVNGQVQERDEKGKIKIVTGTIQNITDHKNLINELNSASKAKDLFLGVASHELKTPLSTMLLLMDSLNRLLDKGELSTNVDKIKEKIKMLQKQGNRFNRLANTLLDITQMNTGNLKFQVQSDVDLSAIANDICQQFADEFKQGNTPLDISIQPEVIGTWDPQRFGQVIYNLMSNALKYGQSRLVTFNLKSENEVVIIEVKDQGVGISDEKKAIIFEKFGRAVDANVYKGIGLGLWIVDEIIKIVGGEICVESVVNKGSTFTAKVPLRIKL